MSNEEAERPVEPRPSASRRLFADEAERIRSNDIREREGLERGADGDPNRIEADRIRSDGIAEPEGVARGVVGDGTLSEAERIRADEIAEPADAARGAVGDDPTRTEADRIRSADLTDDPSV